MFQLLPEITLMALGFGVCRLESLYTGFESEAIIRNLRHTVGDEEYLNFITDLFSEEKGKRDYLKV